MPLEAIQGVGGRNVYRCVECGRAVADPLDSHACGAPAPVKVKRRRAWEPFRLRDHIDKAPRSNTHVEMPSCQAITAKGATCSKWAITKAEWEKWNTGYISRETVRPYLDKLCLLHAKLAAEIA